MVDLELAPVDDASDQLSHRAIMVAISGMILATFIATLSTNILANALPRIVGDLNGEVDQYTWVVTAYILVLTVSVPLWGKLADLTSRTMLLKVALGIYVASSVVTAFSVNTAMLIAGRGVQGLGTGGLAAMGTIALGSLIPPRQRPRYNGYSGAAFALGTVSGPLVGGVLVDIPGLGWRACFLAPIPLGLLALWLIHRNLRLPVVRRQVSVDYVGTALVVLASSAILVWVSLAGDYFPWVSVTSVGLLGTSIVGFTVLIFVERRVAEPVLPLNLFRIPNVSWAAAASFVSGIVAFAYPVFISQLLQLGRGYSAAIAGVITLPMIVGILISTWVLGRLITRTGRLKPFLVLGTVLQLAAVALCAAGLGSAALVWLLLMLLLVGMAIGLLQQNVFILAQNSIGYSQLGSGTAVVQFSRFFGGALGVAVLGALMAIRVRANAVQGFREAGMAIDRQQIEHVPDLTTVAAGVRGVFQHAYAASFQEIFLIFLPFALIPLIAMAAAREPPLRTTIPGRG
jgi:MFS family permease